MNDLFTTRLEKIKAEHEALITKKNEALFSENGIYERYKNPVLTRAHVPLHWRYDLNKESNPFFIERIGFNAAFNAGAMKFNGKYIMVVRTEGNDRKSFFAVAESPNGVDNFRFWDRPITLPQTDEPDTNVYDMRLTKHDDGYIYGVFCSERKDPNAPDGDTSSANRTHQRFDGVGTSSRSDLDNRPATERGAVPAFHRRKICFLHPPAGWFHRYR